MDTSTNVSAYRNLIEKYLSGRTSAVEFCATYFERFQSETSFMPDDVFTVLDELFADVDAFEPDSVIYEELVQQHPGDYLDEKGLREAVERAKSRLPG